MTFWIGYFPIQEAPFLSRTAFPIQKHRPEARRQQGRPRRNHNTPHSLRRSDSTARGLTPREQPEPTTSLTRPGSQASPCVGGSRRRSSYIRVRKPGVATRGSHAHHTAGLLTLSEAGNHLYTGTRSQACHTAALLTPCVPVLLANISSIGSSCTGSLTIAPVAIRGYPRRHIIRK